MFEREYDLYTDRPEIDLFENFEDSTYDDYMLFSKDHKMNISEKIVVPELKSLKKIKFPEKILKPDYSPDDLLYDMSQLEEEYLEEIKKIMSKVNVNSVYKSLIYELDPPIYVCADETYTNIDDIRWNSEIQNYFDKISNMKFSEGEYLNLKNKRYYAKMCYAFQCHLDNLKKSHIYIEGNNINDGKKFSCNMELEYRNSDRYKKRAVARTYALLDEIKKLPEEDRKVTLVTFTTYQKDSEGQALEYLKQYVNLQTNTAKMHDLIRKDYPNAPYMHIIESHKSGYIHIHRIYGCSISRENQEKYKRLWSEKYGAGSYEHGLNFAYCDDDTYYDNIQKTEKQKEYSNIDNAFMYGIKYISKTMTETGTAPFHQFLTDAIIWYVSKRKNRDYKGIRTFYISPKWNRLIKERFAKKESKVEITLVILRYANFDKMIYYENEADIPDWFEGFYFSKIESPPPSTCLT